MSAEAPQDPTAVAAAPAAVPAPEVAAAPADVAAPAADAPDAPAGTDGQDYLDKGLCRLRRLVAERLFADVRLSRYRGRAEEVRRQARRPKQDARHG
jgi:hypothetical protein